MKENSSRLMDREGVIAAIRKAVELAGGERVALDQFLKESGLKYGEVFNHFARWDEALEAAGFRFRRRTGVMIETPALLEDWGRVARQLQRAPTRADYRVTGTFAPRTLTSRFKAWPNIADAFREYAGDGPKWADVVALLANKAKGNSGRVRLRKTTPGQGCATPSRGLRQTQLKHQRRVWISRRERGRKEAMLPVFGQKLGLAALEHAPMNECGVVYLFGVLAEKLGFCVESMRPGFPDCEAKRLVGPDVWERVRIEFEYESRNFKLHGHDPKGCEIIVCWVHNWPECPENLEVIALSEELKRLSTGTPLPGIR